MENITRTDEISRTFAASVEDFTFWHLTEMVKLMAESGIPPEARIRFERNGAGITANWTS